MTTNLCQCARGVTTPQTCIDRLRNTGKHVTTNRDLCERRLCPSCDGELTSADDEGQRCSQCGYPMKGATMSNETCKHGTEPVYRCPVNADHDEVSLSSRPGECSECGAELEMI